MLQSNITLVIATLTLASNVAFVLFITLLYTNKDFKGFVYSFVNKHVLALLFVSSVSALVGSLVYSNIAGFPPCELCWIQRIFMYPQALILFIAMIKRDKAIVFYLFPMTIFGGIVAFYHAFTHYGLGDGLVGCTSALGDCGKLYVFEYGYITIPLMSLTVFVFLFTTSLIYFRSTTERI